MKRCVPTPVTTASTSSACVRLCWQWISAEIRATLADVPLARRMRLKVATTGTTSLVLNCGGFGDTSVSAKRHSATPAPSPRYCACGSIHIASGASRKRSYSRTVALGAAQP
jgi:hypothetical protein